VEALGVAAPAVVAVAEPALELATLPTPVAAPSTSSAHADRVVIGMNDQGLQLQVQPPSIPPAMREARRPNPVPVVSAPGLAPSALPASELSPRAVRSRALSSTRPAAPAPRPVTALAPPVAPKPPALGPILFVVVAVALLMIGGAVALVVRGLHGSQAAATAAGAQSPTGAAPSPPPSAAIAPSDAPVASAASGWAKVETNLFSNADKDRVRGLISALEQAGARGVFASGISRQGMVQIASELRVELPLDAGHRQAVYRAIAGFRGWAIEVRDEDRASDPFAGRESEIVRL
jgi:hypothetical protein